LKSLIEQHSYLTQNILIEPKNILNLTQYKEEAFSPQLLESRNNENKEGGHIYV